jgi:hypothetical protein
MRCFDGQLPTTAIFVPDEVFDASAFGHCDVSMHQLSGPAIFLLNGMFRYISFRPLRSAGGAK